MATVRALAGGLGTGAANCLMFTDANGNNASDSGLTYAPSTGEILNANHVETSITAGTTQTQAGGYALTKRFSVVTVCANANDGVTLATGSTGRVMSVKNQGAQTLKVYPPTGGTINGGSANAAVTLATTVGGTYICTDGTAWISV